MADEGRDNAGVIAPPPLIYALPLALGVLLDRRLHVPFLPKGATRPLGLSLLAAGFSLAAWFDVTMWRAGTPVDPRKPVSNVVAHGPFALTRNPAYLAMASMYCGVCALRNALLPLLLLPVVVAVIQKGVVEREERYLEGKFGDEYRRYTETVRRWI